MVTDAGEPMNEPGNDSGTSIGSAHLDPDGTIVLQLRATGPGIRGDALLRYPKDHPQYRAVLEHLGGLAAGEEKPVPPWAD